MNNKSEIYKIGAVIVIIDQIIKILIKKYLKENKFIKIIPNFFSLYHVKNTGAAFSILENNTILLIIIGFLVLIFLDKEISKEKNLDKYQILSLGMIIGGIIGNLLDRIMYHGVIDYLSFQFGSYYFPIFNFADIGITLGVLLLIINTYLMGSDKKWKKYLKKK